MNTNYIHKKIKILSRLHLYLYLSCLKILLYLFGLLNQNHWFCHCLGQKLKFNLVHPKSPRAFWRVVLKSSSWVSWFVVHTRVLSATWSYWYCPRVRRRACRQSLSSYACLTVSYRRQLSDTSVRGRKIIIPVVYLLKYLKLNQILLFLIPNSIVW
jgi:hypothetical protein